MLLSDTVTYRARSRPDDVALVFEDIVITYADLTERLHRLANALADLAAPGDRVAILSENRPEYIDCYYGVPRAGMGLCFVNFRLAPREIVRIVNDAEAGGARHRGALPRARERHPGRAHHGEARGGRGRRRRPERHRVRGHGGGGLARAAGVRARSWRPRVAHLHERHDGHAQGRHVEPPQPAGGGEQRGHHLGARGARDLPQPVAAVPRVGLPLPAHAPARQHRRADAVLRPRAVPGPHRDSTAAPRRPVRRRC